MQADYIYRGVLVGLSARESLLYRPGVVMDLYETYLRANGLKRKEADDMTGTEIEIE